VRDLRYDFCSATADRGTIGLPSRPSRGGSGHSAGATTTDPLTFTVAIAGLALVGCAACAVPARRASVLNPAIALKAE
jgi:hypothetical protein